ncbi:hypothetical protein EVAR_23925_1 [Eumeta japonica]|uniref:Uncharacterized protein n=1 Tax=Eumeta variegata TaxID=151549 RepID=A0A4C1V2G4_EUMVA|nr:hypothetical protein EVAR_23925_1 [Eumeta japonica]
MRRACGHTVSCGRGRRLRPDARRRRHRVPGRRRAHTGTRPRDDTSLSRFSSSSRFGLQRARSSSALIIILKANRRENRESSLYRGRL